MTVPRSVLVDLEVTPYYHCISRCVRRAQLCGEGFEHRKAWLETRVEELASIFAVSIASFSVLDNHFHLVVRLEGKKMVDRWSNKEVAERWGRLYPPRGKKRKPLPVTEAWLKEQCSNAKWIKRTRERLANLGWFMKCLKEPLAKMANREDECRGAFWESRYNSIAILDDLALLATCAYTDLNPFAAGIGDLPENSPHTSVKVRMENCRNRNRYHELQAALMSVGRGEVVADDKAARLEEQLWLCPLAKTAKNRFGNDGMLDHFSLAHYLELLEWTSRLARDGKQRLSDKVPPLLERLGTNVDTWQAAIGKMFARQREQGVVFSFSRAHLQEVAAHRGCHHVANLNGCPA